MVIRLIAIMVLGFVLTGSAPRWLSTGQLSWTIWLTSAVLVIAGPRISRRLIGRLWRLVRAT